ncbi:MAG TPA: hypothetical protein VFJ67_01170 [Thermodesulfobacteriota bacterium]|nr:hypothetical protein [Thermodesulfobacteriota bacterium]
MLVNWDNLGISGESNFLQLFYDPHSETLVAHFFRSIGGGYGLRSLWTRRVTDERYVRITSSDSYLSYEDIVLCPSSAHVFANVMRVEKKGASFDGYEWHSIQRIDLLTGEAEVIAESGSEGFDTGQEKIWISTLHGASADCRELYCSAAVQKKGKGAVSPTEYYLSRLVIGEGRIERITRLSATFL